ncbi:MAG TPA: LptF/LptG family permease [Candidatus Synoicihabitans sp.]|nr:LptF/LptG family permease [Candidatus Synoicihabitans sp.]
MNLLQRHLFWSVLSTCLAAVGLFMFVLILGNALKDLLGYLLAGQIGLGTFAKLLGLLVPYACAYALPMGILTGVLLVLGRMSAQHEITAMRAAGLSLTFVARPILLLGLIGSAAALAVNFYYMPRSRTLYKQMVGQAVQQNPLSFVVPKTFVREFNGVVLYVGEKDGPRLRDFWVWQIDKQDRVRVFARADEGIFEYDQTTNTLVLTLRHVVVENRADQDPEDFTRAPTTSTFDEFPVKLELDALFGRQVPRTKLAWMTLDQLIAEWRRLAAPEQAMERLRVSITLHEKASSGLAVLAFALLAVPLGIKVSRKETSANLGVALGLVMVYYFASVTVSWLDQFPDLRPDWLMWAPTLGFFALGAWLFSRVGRA